MRSVIGPVGLAFCLQSLPGHALKLRAYQAAVHDRFTDFPAAPAMNPGFLHDAARFTGVGWYVPDPRRQFTLVTPRHFVCASHFTPAVGQLVRFVGSDGVVVERAVAAVAAVPNDSGGNSDLALGTLDSEAPGTVEPLRWLNLAEEDAYRGARLMAFGRAARGGNGVLAGFKMLDETGIADTRASYFIYRTLSGDADDCFFESGDSGSPCFATVNGEPALVSVNSAVGNASGTVTNYGAFVPYYAAKLDAMLAAEDYSMSPVFPSPAGLTLERETQPGTLRRLREGAATFTVGNVGSLAAGNLVVVAVFDPAAAPDHLSAPGWTVSAGAEGTWTLQSACLDPGGELAFTASWPILPEAAEIACSVDLVSDVSPDAFHEMALEIAPSYAEWSKDLAEAGLEDDPDGDGLPNLLEYALGGDPESASPQLAPGVPLRPVVTVSGGEVTVTYPERGDGELRGISYIVEVSDSLAAGSWTSELPEGAVSATGSWMPVVPGFVKREITWPADGPRRFVRLRVELEE